MSGSPLRNQHTGKVGGMVKFTRDRSFDLGGSAIPTRVILEQWPQLRKLQQEFHPHKGIREVAIELRRTKGAEA